MIYVQLVLNQYMKRDIMPIADVVFKQKTKLEGKRWQNQMTPVYRIFSKA
jgi:hypothetical protein